MYLIPKFSDRSNFDAWGNSVVAQGRGYGVGDMTQYYGVAPGQAPVQPFNVALTGAGGASGLQSLPSQLAETGPELTKFTQSLAGADGGLGQFSGSLSGLAKDLFSGGGGDGLGGVASLFSGLAGGFAGGGLIRGDGTPTSDSNAYAPTAPKSGNWRNASPATSATH